MTGSGFFFAKGHPPHPSLCQAQSEAHGPPSAMAVRKTRRGAELSSKDILGDSET